MQLWYRSRGQFPIRIYICMSRKTSALTMYYTINTAFMHYFDSLTENLETHISQNWTTQEHVFPILLQTFEFDTKLLKAPKTLKDLVHHYKQKAQIINKTNNKNIKHSFFDNIIMDLFVFIAAILSMIATEAIIHLVCRHTKLKVLLTGIAFQPVKQTEAIFGHRKKTAELCSTIVYNSSVNFNGHSPYNTYFGNHTEVHNIQKAVFQYSYSDAFLFRYQTICSS